VRLIKIFVLSTCVFSASCAVAASIELDMLETEELRLLYFDPFQTYLVPNVTRSFHNSLEFQKYIFNWTPYEKTTVLLFPDEP
jgi:hypothetical protein